MEVMFKTFIFCEDESWDKMDLVFIYLGLSCQAAVCQMTSTSECCGKAATARVWKGVIMQRIL